MYSKELNQLLFDLNDVEKNQLIQGSNYNYMDLDFINNPIPEMPQWHFFNDGNIAVTKSNRFSYVPAHSHSFIELNYMYHGSCTQYINDEKIELREGNLILMDKDIVQRIDYTGKDDILVNILIKSDSDVSSIFSMIPESLNIISQLIYNSSNENSLHNNFILFDLYNHPVATNLVEIIIEDGLIESPSSQRNQSMELVLSALIIKLKSLVQRSVVNFGNGDVANILPIVKYINNNYATATLTSTSKYFGYNRNYLSNKLKRTSGKSFQELIDRRRLSVAENLMIKTNLTNEGISELLGYKDVASMFRLFKHYMDTTPSSYRKKVHPVLNDVTLNQLLTQTTQYKDEKA